MASYTSEYPPIPFDAAYKQFFEDFYATSDTPDAHAKYVEQFTPDAMLIMASKKAKGSEGSSPTMPSLCSPYSSALSHSPAEILALRKGLWEKVNSRLHRASKIFPYGPNADEVMLHGTVQYKLKAGGESSVDWAAYAHLVKVDGVVKMDFYQVYLVGQVMSGAMSFMC